MIFCNLRRLKAHLLIQKKKILLRTSRIQAVPSTVHVTHHRVRNGIKEELSAITTRRLSAR